MLQSIHFYVVILCHDVIDYRIVVRIFIWNLDMRVVTTRRPKTIFVKKGSVDQASSFLDTLPEKPKEEFSLRAAAHYLREPIRAALTKGYTYEEVAALLAEHGIAISASTLKNYVPSGKRQSTKEGSVDGSRKTRKAEAKSTPTEASDVGKQDDNVLPFVAPKAAKQEKDTSAPAKRRTRATAAKNQPETSTTAKAPAKSEATSRQKTTSAKSTRKPTTRGRKKAD
jgi:hypothetical protein